MRGKVWTQKELKYLVDRYPHDQSKDIAKHLGRSICGVYGKAHNLGLNKSEAFLNDHKKSGRCRMIEHGKVTRFKKGDKPWNTGKKVEIKGRMSETFFKKGNLPKNTLHDGAITIRSLKGRKYKWIRLDLAKWDLLHRVLWRRHYGKIPKGLNVQFKDGDPMNCQIDNLELVTKREAMRRNTIHRYPPEVKTAIRTISKLDRTIKNAKK